jgi:hypothetical protein
MIALRRCGCSEFLDLDLPVAAAKSKRRVLAALVGLVDDMAPARQEFGVWPERLNDISSSPL